MCADPGDLLQRADADAFHGGGQWAHVGIASDRLIEPRRITVSAAPMSVSDGKGILRNVEWSTGDQGLEIVQVVDDQQTPALLLPERATTSQNTRE